MRIGIVAMPRDRADRPPQDIPERFTSFARQVERLGFAGLWLTDSLGRGRPTFDPLMLMMSAAAATTKIELGTCVLQVPIRNPVELAHRVQTVNLFSGGRVRLGVGAGSTKHDFDALGHDYEGRFKALPGAIETMRRVWRGEKVLGPALTQWRGTEGGPPVRLGAWRSPRWIELAAKLDGWVASGIHTKWEDLGIGIGMVRKAGGKRTVLANIFTDLRPEPEPNPTQFPLQIELRCAPAEAKARLKRLADMGLDDALLAVPFDDPAQLEQVRGLHP
jgi:alkanesulfonate monooxygenase SsuD/methylene tetrahydromethanopterin reductase-like flavin-dependent oxidoreductase (luciferase family)